MKKVVKKFNRKEYITQAEFARRIGIHPVTVGQGVKTGRWKLYYVDGSKLIKYAEAKRAFTLTKKNYMKGPIKKANGKTPKTLEISEDGLSDVPHDLHDARLQNEKYKAMKTRLDFEVAQAKVISFQDVYDTWKDISENLKKSILAIADRIGPLAAAEMDNHSCTMLLRTELKRSLQGIVDKYSKKIEVQKDG